METYKLHPLVLINVSDHHTRFAAQREHGDPTTSEQTVLGCLLGFQTGTREVEICISFEVSSVADAVTGKPAFDQQYLTDQLARYKQNFPKFELVGWYCVGAAVDEVHHVRLHESLSHMHESPVFLLFDPSRGTDDAVTDEQRDAMQDVSCTTSKKNKKSSPSRCSNQ
jgi:COP9 signalosome complex subunit 6